MFFVILGCRKFIGVCGWFVCLFLRIPETFLWNPVGVCETTNGSRPQHNNVPRPRPKIKDLELCGKLLLIQYPSQVILQNTAERFLAIGYKMFCHGWVPFCLLQNEMRLWVYEYTEKRLSANFLEKIREKVLFEGGRVGTAPLTVEKRPDGELSPLSLEKSHLSKQLDRRNCNWRYLKLLAPLSPLISIM